MIVIVRLWDIMDFDYKLDIDLLFKRPRVDYRISEYVFDYINKKILKPYKIMQTGNYSIGLSLAKYNEDRQKYLEDSIYNTETEKYDSDISNITKKGTKYKDILLFSYSTNVNENIKPKEYANMVYDMIGAFLIKQYKKITKDIMDANKTDMDYELIEEFIYPALFHNQKYLSDNEEASYSDGEKLVQVDVEGEYKKHYKE